MTSVRSVLFLDFDSVFRGLLELDPDVAIRFAQDPLAWVNALADRDDQEPPRWLVLRCYIDPNGSATHPLAPNTRVKFSAFLDPFISAGFEVISTPGSAIQLTMDVADALWVEPLYDEFVVASDRPDLVPLMIRLRGAGRRTTLVCAREAEGALRAVPDDVVSGTDLAGVLVSDRASIEPPAAEVPTPVGQTYVGRHAGPARTVELPKPRSSGGEQPALAQRVPRVIPRFDGPDEVPSDGWFGAGHTTS